MRDLLAKQRQLLFRLGPKISQNTVDQRNIATKPRNDRRFRFQQRLSNYPCAGRRVTGCEAERDFFAIDLSVQRRHQLLDINRLTHVIVHAGSKTRLAIGVRCIRRHRDNR